MNVLSIAGFDPSGGAGVLADIKTFLGAGVDGCGVVTAITAQNTHAVNRVEPVDAGLVRAQLETLLEDVSVAAVKIGMLGNAAVARVVADAVRRYSLPNVVVDPVLRASAGETLFDPDALDVLGRELIARASLVTPNASEAGALLGRPAPKTMREMHEAAAALRHFGPPWILLTGGHVDLGDDCVDLLFGRDQVHEIRVPRVHGAEMHGSGCALSSAIAARLALGASMLDACADAQRYVAARIAAEHSTRSHPERSEGSHPVARPPYRDADEILSALRPSG